MLIFIFFVFLAITCFRFLTHDIGAMSLLIAVGFLQDPIRKLMINEPVYMSIVVGVVAGCAFVRLLISRKEKVLDPYTRWSQELPLPLMLFLIIIFAQFIHSLVRYGTPILPILGMIFYIAPLVAICVGYTRFISFSKIRAFLLTHIAFAVIVAATVLLSFTGTQSVLFEEVGAGLAIYDQGTVLKAHSGLMRSSEIAGWHLGASACFALILAASRNSLPSTVLTAFAIILIASAIILTGRRKMIFQIVIFSVLYFPFLRLYQRRMAAGYFVTASMLASFIALLALWLFPLMSNAEFELYLMRGSSVFGDATDRFSNFGLGSVGWAIDQFGLLGGGLGVAAQGAQHFGGVISTSAAEGGLGKIVSELGAVSLIIIVWLLYVILVHVHRCLILVAKAMPQRLPFTVGVAVFVISNVPTFMVASQVFGDVFILLIIGLMTGFLFAVPRIILSNMADSTQIQTTKTLHV